MAAAAAAVPERSPTVQQSRSSPASPVNVTPSREGRPRRHSFNVPQCKTLSPEVMEVHRNAKRRVSSDLSARAVFNVSRSNSIDTLEKSIIAEARPNEESSWSPPLAKSKTTADPKAWAAALPGGMAERVSHLYVGAAGAAEMICDRMSIPDAGYEAAAQLLSAGWDHDVIALEVRFTRRWTRHVASHRTACAAA
eukprot:1098155-Prymnesium_polylepis.1